MSNLERDPAELTCRSAPGPVDAAGHCVVEVLGARAVPLGGPRAMPVYRTLPQRHRTLIGPWCFVDHYGPDDVAVTGGMDVPPHPHAGLQTVSWLFHGELEHRDSGGGHVTVRPGELNVMTGGAGICHSEVSTPATTVLHGVQLWLALPDAARGAPRALHHHVPAPVAIGAAEVRVFLGELAGQRSPVPVHHPVLGAELTLPARARVRLPVAPEHEHGLLVDSAALRLAGTDLSRTELGFVGAGTTALTIDNPTDAPGRALLIGGAPFGEQIVLWWNFVARSHEEIAALRADWAAESERFGAVAGYRGRLARLPAPALAPVRLRPRGNPPSA